MPDRGTLGQILLKLGKIDEDDVARALDHQSRHGGYFGEALLALKLVSAEELEWGLASQFDLPYIFPDPEAIDPDAASLVSPEWALAHQSIPIMRAGETLTVVVDSPLRTEMAAELEERLGLQVELALAPPDQIRELIRSVYARATTWEEGESPLPCSLEEAMSRASAARARRFGISVRDRRASFWYDDGGTMRRRPLDIRWESALDAVSSPPVRTRLAQAPGTTLESDLSREQGITRTEVRHMAEEAGEEILFLVREEEDTPDHGFSRPGEGILTEVRLLTRTGSARFLVETTPPEMAGSLLPHLPSLFFGPGWRSVHLASAPVEAPGVFAVEMPRDRASWGDRLEELRTFHFDVLTVELGGDDTRWVEAVLDVASVAFIALDSGTDPAPAREAGIRWTLRATRTEGGYLEWSLDALDN